MKISRRTFLATSLAGAAGLSAGGFATGGLGAESLVQPPDEDGSKLWLRYVPPGDSAKNERNTVRQLRVEGTSGTLESIRAELRTATTAMLGDAVPLDDHSLQDGAVIVGTPASSSLIRNLNWIADLRSLADEGFIIRSVSIEKHPVTVIAANTDLGALYGSFHFLRLIQTGQPIDPLDLTERPALQLRLMNHWDNPNGTIERGYGGRSLWQWNKLPDELSPRYAVYARACAAIGINGAVINNVNADPRILDAESLRKVAALAGVWRPYGVRMYLSASFAAPTRLADWRQPTRWTKASPIGGKPKRMRFTGKFPISAAFWSRQTPKVNPAPKPMAAVTPTAPTCWPTPSRRTKATSSGAPLFMTKTLIQIAPNALTWSSPNWTGNSAPTWPFK